MLCGLLSNVGNTKIQKMGRGVLSREFLQHLRCHSRVGGIFGSIADNYAYFLISSLRWANTASSL
jgi:hypothetical protein